MENGLVESAGGGSTPGVIFPVRSFPRTRDIAKIPAASRSGGGRLGEGPPLSPLWRPDTTSATASAAMADTSRRKGGAAAARSHQTYMQMNAARTPTNQPGGPRGFAGTPTNQPGVPRGFAGTPTNQQGGPRGFAGTPTNQQGGSRGFAGTPTNANRGGGFNKASNGRGGKGQLPAKMGIKSGMTVEVRDLEEETLGANEALD